MNRIEAKIRAQYEERVLALQADLAAVRAAARPIPERIYVCGSHRAGKTTLARWISKTYNLPLITEVARMVLAEMETDFTALRSDVDQVGLYQTQVFIRQQVEEKRHTSFVSDRAADNLAYAAEHTDLFADLLYSPATKDYFGSISKNSVVFFLHPHQRFLRPDAANPAPAWDEVVRIDAMVKILLEQHRVPYVHVHTPDAQERQRLVGTVLRLAGLSPSG